jgi:hypothetical protein
MSPETLVFGVKNCVLGAKQIPFAFLSPSCYTDSQSADTPWFVMHGSQRAPFLNGWLGSTGRNE